MQVKFDLFNRKRTPSLILCNPNGKELYSLAMAKNKTVSMSLNGLSELTFEVPRYVNKDKITPYYDHLKTHRLVKVEDLGQFIITNIDINSNGVTESKSVTCKGLEFELSSRNIDFLDGTYALYNVGNVEKSLLHIVMSYLPTWRISKVDSELWDIWRTFSIQDNNIYNFLMGEVQEAFDCVFLFNTFERSVEVVKTSNLPKKTDIYLSNKNLMKELNISENSDNIITALDVYGDGDLSIRTVNPLGKPTIYDFSYFANTEWMSQGLIDALKKWENKLKEKEVVYGDLLEEVKKEETKLISLKTELNNLETEKKALEQKHGMAVVAEDQEACAKYAQEVKEKEKLIEAKKAEIKEKEKLIEGQYSQLKEISKSLSFENNFTEEQIKELDCFIYQASIQNTNYSTTDLTTIEEQRDIMKSLYDWGKQELKKNCQPIWEFNIDAINFLNLIQYKKISNQLELGSEVTIEVDRDKDLFAKALLLGYTLDLDGFGSLELKFSNVLRFNSGSFTFEELFDSTASISKTFDFESNSWNKGEEAYSMIDEYINSALDLTTQEIKATDNQEFVISNVGIRGKEYLPETDTYSPKEIWITKNKIAFSDDSFNSTKTALGEIVLPDGSRAYGLIGEYLVGKMLCGKTLVLENDKSTFRIDGEGVYIKDANIIMTSEDGQEQSIPDMIATSTEKIDKVLTPDGLLDTNKMQGQILAGTNNIFCVNSARSKALLINDTGILISNQKSGDSWVWKTAITADGISADVIQANGTLSGVNIVGGSLNIGSGAFTVDSGGNVKITKGTINMGNDSLVIDSAGTIKITKGSIDLGGGSFTLDSYGNIKITKGSINIGNGAFSVNTSGNVIARSITLTEDVKGDVDANSLRIRNLVVGENVTMGRNATISWENISSKPEIPVLPSYIKSTKITSTRIEAPEIIGGLLEGATIRQTSDNSSQHSDCELIGGRLQFKQRSKTLGVVMGDVTDGKLWVEGYDALKLSAFYGSISLNARQGKIYMESDVVFEGRLLDNTGSEINAVAKFA